MIDIIKNTNQLACSEVIEVIKRIPEEQRKCIPVEVISNLNSKAYGKEITLKYDSAYSLCISIKAKEILVYLFKEYILKDNESLQDKLNQKLRENEYIKERIKQNNLKYEIKFDKRKTNSVTTTGKLVEYKENFLKRILKRLLNFFK